MEVYGTPLVHPIDGDGMVCRITFTKDGRALFKSRFVRTSGFVDEQKAQRALYRGMMGTKPKAVGGDDSRAYLFKNPSNTNVWQFGGRVISAWESGPPYELDPGSMTTRGKSTLDGALTNVKTYQNKTVLERLVISNSFRVLTI